MVRRHVLLLVAGCAVAWSPRTLRAETVPLVPVQVRVQTDSDWTKVDWVGLNFIVLRHRVMFGHQAQGISVSDFHIRKRRGDRTRLRVDFDTVLVGGFGPHHRCTIGKAFGGQTVIAMAFGYDHQRTPFFTVTHTKKVDHDPQHRQSFLFNVPAALQGGSPSARLPAPAFQSRRVAFYPPGQSGTSAPPDDARIEADLARLRAAGADLVVVDWDGPGTASDRFIGRVLAAAGKHGTQVVPNITTTIRRPPDVRRVVTQAGARFAAHQAVAKVNGRYLLMFDDRVVRPVAAKRWEEMLLTTAGMAPKPFMIATGYDPKLLSAGFDGIYTPLVHHTGVPMPRTYLGSYAYARAVNKLFLSSPIDVAERYRTKMSRNYYQCVKGCAPTWTVKAKPAGVAGPVVSSLAPVPVLPSARPHARAQRAASVRYSGTRSAGRRSVPRFRANAPRFRSSGSAR